MYQDFHLSKAQTQTIEQIGLVVEACPKNKFDKFDNILARMQGPLYHMTLKWHFICDFAVKRDFICISKRDIVKYVTA